VAWASNGMEFSGRAAGAACDKDLQVHNRELERLGRFSKLSTDGPRCIAAADLSFFNEFIAPM